jgi:hypothetical protein
MKTLDLVGKKFGRYLVQDFAGSINGRRHWNCICDCGSNRCVSGQNLTTGHSKSCGCLRDETVANMARTHGHTPIGNHHHLYETWCGIKARCNNPDKTAYKYYGARGIRVDPRWENSFETFLSDMESTWKPGLSINRKDNDGPYCKENCTWATRKEQSNNRSNCVMLTHNGKTLNLTQWGELLGIGSSTLYARYRSKQVAEWVLRPLK